MEGYGSGWAQDYQAAVPTARLGDWGVPEWNGLIEGCSIQPDDLQPLQLENNDDRLQQQHKYGELYPGYGNALDDYGGLGTHNGMRRADDLLYDDDDFGSIGRESRSDDNWELPLQPVQLQLQHDFGLDEGHELQQQQQPLLLELQHSMDVQHELQEFLLPQRQQPVDPQLQPEEEDYAQPLEQYEPSTVGAYESPFEEEEAVAQPRSKKTSRKKKSNKKSPKKVTRRGVSPLVRRVSPREALRQMKRQEIIDRRLHQLLNPPSKPKNTHWEYCTMTGLAILRSPHGRLPVAQLYEFIRHHFPVFATNPKSWKSSLRHNLTGHDHFQKVHSSQLTEAERNNANKGRRNDAYHYSLNPEWISKLNEKIAIALEIDNKFEAAGGQRSFIDEVDFFECEEERRLKRLQALAEEIERKEGKKWARRAAAAAARDAAAARADALSAAMQQQQQQLLLYETQQANEPKRKPAPKHKPLPDNLETVADFVKRATLEKQATIARFSDPAREAQKGKIVVVKRNTTSSSSLSFVEANKSSLNYWPTYGSLDCHTALSTTSSSISSLSPPLSTHSLSPPPEQTQQLQQSYASLDAPSVATDHAYI